MVAAARVSAWPEDRFNTFIRGQAPDGENRSTGDGRTDASPTCPCRPSTRGGWKASADGSWSAPDAGAEVDWARRALSGRELPDERTGKPTALLALISANDPNVSKKYLGRAAVWATVAPVVLPGRDEADAPTLPRRVRTACVEWRRVGFGRGSIPRLGINVRVCWPTVRRRRPRPRLGVFINDES